MEQGQKEFTEKIRFAIKEKLTEISAFVDDELPDYIMILVANKRSKPQIEKDLILFLGDDTPAFTNWLWNLVKNLKVNSNTKPSSSLLKKDEIYVKGNSPSDDDDDVLACDLDEQESDDMLDQDDELKNLSQGVYSQANRAKVNISSPVTTDINTSKPAEKEFLDSHPMHRPPNVFPVREMRSVPVLSTVVPVQQHMLNLADEYDPTEPNFSGNVASAISISQRNYGGPAALQANKLLLRAVSEATKSILHGQNINDFYKPTPIKVLSSSKKDDSTRFRNLVNVKINSDFEFNAKPKEPEFSNLDQSSNESEMYTLDTEDYPLSSTPRSNRTICLTSDSTDLNVLEETSNCPSHSNSSPSLMQDERVSSPHFIVTLDGVDFSLKRKYSEASDGSMELDDDTIPIEDEGDVIGSAAPEKKQKITERCKFWPACKNSDECAFHHPTIPCKCFPACKYGDRCLYIHPNCKFDALCSRKDCPYTHASKRKFPLMPAKIHLKKQGLKTVCKFYPKCTVNKCPFVHPRLCRYGTKCRLPVCPYSHFNLPSRNQMRWKATA